MITSAGPIPNAPRRRFCRARTRAGTDMSLLLEALKKAEKAKEEAQRRAKGEPQAPELRIENEPSVAEKPVLTRAELPDIRQPLEILSEEIAPRPPEPAPQGQAFEAPQSADRAIARKVFEAKFKEPNPRLHFQIAIASLGLATIGIVAYFWYQLRPPPPLVNLNPPRAAQQAAAPAPAPEARPTAATTTTPAAIPGLPPVAAAPD